MALKRGKSAAWMLASISWLCMGTTGSIRQTTPWLQGCWVPQQQYNRCGSCLGAAGGGVGGKGFKNKKKWGGVGPAVWDCSQPMWRASVCKLACNKEVTQVQSCTSKQIRDGRYSQDWLRANFCSVRRGGRLQYGSIYPAAFLTMRFL